MIKREANKVFIFMYMYICPLCSHACHMCAYSAEAGVVLGALSLLEAVVSYSLLPRDALPAFVAALCRTVNVEQYCQTSRKVCHVTSRPLT